MTVVDDDFDETLLVERIAALLGFERLSSALPGDIWPPYLFVVSFLLLDHGIVNGYIHLTGGTHILLAAPNIFVAPLAVLFAAFGIRYMWRNYAQAIRDLNVEQRADDEITDRFARTMSWRVKAGIYVLAVVVLYANVLFNVGLSTINRPGGGLIDAVNWLFVFEVAYLPFVVEFALVYFAIHVSLPRRIEQADIGLYFYDPQNMGGFASVGQLLKRSYYLYTAGLLLFFIVVYGAVILSLGETPATAFSAAFFSAAWFVGVLSIAYSMLTIHRLMASEKRERIRELEAEMREVIEKPYDINESTVTDENELDDIRRRLEEVRGTRVYPATFTMWSQILISVLLPQALQLVLQATA